MAGPVNPNPPSDDDIDELDDACPCCWHSLTVGHGEGGVCWCGCVYGFDGWTDQSHDMEAEQ